MNYRRLAVSKTTMEYEEYKSSLMEKLQDSVMQNGIVTGIRCCWNSQEVSKPVRIQRNKDNWIGRPYFLHGSGCQQMVMIGTQPHLACIWIRIALVDTSLKDNDALLCHSAPFARRLICYRVGCEALGKFHENY